MGERWGPAGPPPEAYSRVTSPDRFAPVVAAADALVARLSKEYDVVDGDAQLDGATRAVRLLPVVGAQITIGITDFPGVVYSLGHWCRGNAPMCGCDACDETAEEAINQLTTTVDDVVAGRFVERLTRNPPRLWMEFADRRGWSLLDPDTLTRLSAVAPPGTHEWPAWRRRTSVAKGSTA